MNALARSVSLALALSLAALAAACGGSEPQVEAPPPPAETAAPAPSSAAPEAVPPVATAAPSATPAPPSGPAGTPVTFSKFTADVKRLGIDLAKSPVLEKMATAEKKKLMPLFVKSLGYKDCTGCHASLGDFKTVTHNMQITRGMWDHFVAYGRDTKDAPMFCDSCHNGGAKILNRADREGVKKFMESDYVGKIHRADKKPMECTTCHGDSMELDIFGKVWGVH